MADNRDLDESGKEVENLDVLQNIESLIIATAREMSGVDDYDVMGALDAAIKDFRDLERGREPRPHSLQGAVPGIFRSVMAVCDWRLGRGPGPDAAVDGEDLPDPAPLPPAEILRCLRKIRRSVDHWHDVGGSRGYLDFIAAYFPTDGESPPPSRER